MKEKCIVKLRGEKEAKRKIKKLKKEAEGFIEAFRKINKPLSKLL